MKSLHALITAFALTAPLVSWAEVTPTPTTEAKSDTIAGRQGRGLDLNVDVGAAPFLPDSVAPHLTNRISVRADVGFLSVKEPRYIGVGGTLGIAPRSEFVIGPYANIVHLWSGLWASGAVMLGHRGTVMTALSAGWSVLGAEVQISQREPIFLLKLRAPIGIPLFARKEARTRIVPR